MLTVASFGLDTTTHRLESNIIDFGLPMEMKTLSKIETYVEGSHGNAQYSIEISVDGGLFFQRHTTNGGYDSTDLSGLNLDGRRFQYAIVYETKSSGIKLPFKESMSAPGNSISTALR